MPDGVAGFLRRAVRRLVGRSGPVHTSATMTPKGGQHAQA
jgi:hypothetical protein